MNQTYNIIAVVILGLVLELILAYKLKSDKKRLDKISKKYNAEFKKTKDQLEKIVTSVRNESAEVVTITLNQYKKVHAQVIELTKDIPLKIETDLTKQTQTYQELLAKKAISSTQLIDNVVQEEIQKISKKIQEEIESTQKKVVTDLLTDTQLAKQDITNFKQQKINEISQKSEEILEKVTKKYLGKSLNNKDQHEITLKLIDELWQTGELSE